jgi:hypothetical protein
LKNLNFSCSVLNWFHSYLDNRTQAVLGANNSRSTWLTVPCGVPQGSVLGPLLFSLYILDIAKNLRFCKYMLYADDLQIYFHANPNDLAAAISLVNEDVSAICAWARENLLVLNSSKTKAIIFGNSRILNKINFSLLPYIKVSDAEIGFSNTVRNLGITLTSNLSWNDHINEISNKVNKTLYQLKLHKSLLPIATRKMLVSTLVFPAFDYCTLLYNDLPLALESKLQRLLNSCARFVLDLRKDEHISEHLNNLSWLRISTRRKYFLGSFLFTLFSNKYPAYLYSMFKPKSVSVSRITRTDPSYLLRPIPRTNTYLNSFLISGSNLWNSLPISIKNSSSLSIFKEKLYKHYLNEQLHL